MMATVLGVTLTYSMEETRKQLAVNEQVMLNLLGDLSRIALLTAEYDELQPYIEQVVNDPNVSAVLLANNKNTVVVSNRYSYLGRPIPNFINGESRHWRSLTIDNKAGNLGTLAMQFSEENLIKTNKEVMNLGITIALIGMFSIAIFGVLVGYLLTRRLETLTSSAEQLAGGNLDARTNFSGKDEVSIVGHAFDQMARNVSDNMSALQKATDLLEQRVTERTEELAIARDDAIHANRSKSAFLANMSHEIRTPLTAIIGYSESMLESKLSETEQTESINTIIRSGKHLLNIINDILDLSKIEAEKMEIELLPLSPFELLYDVQSLIVMLAEDKGLTFKIDYELPLPETITCDPIRLKQILINLANNAIKFTREGSVRIQVKCNIELEQMVFKVIDTGIGMDKEQIDKLFQPFTQADSSTTRKFGGTGLGLHLSKELAEKLGGTIVLESTLDVGSCFELTISTGDLVNTTILNKVPAHCNIENITQHKQLDTKVSGKVLLAEDNPDNQRLVSMLIRQTGADVDIAENGREAVNMALADPYDLILMDMQMPVMCGMDAVIKLRKHGYDKPIVALTANAMHDDILVCKKAGCDGHVSKPIDRVKFRDLLHKYLMPVPDNSQTQSPIYSPIIESEPDLIDVLKMFINRLPGMLTNICEAYESKNYAELNDLTHDMKGTSGNFGYETLYELSQKIEDAISKENYNEISDLLIEVEKTCQRILAGFQTQPIILPLTGK